MQPCMTKWLLTVYCLHLLAGVETCDKRPLGTVAAPLPPDDTFQITIDEIIDNKYIPQKKYTVTLSSSNSKSKFIAFTISLSEDTMENLKNARRPIPLQAGNLIPFHDSDDAVISCNNTLIQSNIVPKTSVKVQWIAPPKGQKCVTIYALVAVKNDVWYDKEGPLVQQVCEDLRQKDDMLPQLNYNCNICTEARYLLKFEGLWKYNTHPSTFPQLRQQARFSDIVGASHSENFHLWDYNKEASLGLKMLAEQGNTTQLEVEIQDRYFSAEKISQVRTIIKAKSPPAPDGDSFSLFRVNRDNHRISLLTAILPSPDWFLGVSHMELCESGNNWSKSVTLNLYPNDAGTDSGKNFESPNEETSPAQPISTLYNDGSDGDRKVKPFAKLQINLVRIYRETDCEKNDSFKVDGSYDDITNEPANPEYEVTTPSPEPNPDPELPDDCPLTEWENWMPCEGLCVDGKISKGHQTRVRYHLVDGIPVEKYNRKDKHRTNKYINKEVPIECKEKYSEFDVRPCTKDCDDVNVKFSEHQQDPIIPGSPWQPNKR